jgi:tRNA nucleotidyltransferase/poly(A) polymerase
MTRKQSPETRLRAFGCPAPLRLLRSRFPKAEVYLVGGSVRDQLLGRKSNDLDVVVRNVSYEQLARYFRKHGSAQFVGRRFGVLKFKPRHGNQSYDIALPRLEHSLGLNGGYRDFDVRADPGLPIEADLQRRDFSVNALAWDFYKLRLIDPSGGLADLAGRRIRAVGDASLRFREDYTRLLRALRFSVTLDFTIEDQTWFQLKSSISHLNDAVLPRELVAAELIRMFEAKPLETIDLLELSGALRILMPEALAMQRCVQPPEFHSEGTVWAHGRLAVEALGTKEFHGTFPKLEVDVELVLAAWLHDIGKPFAEKTIRKNGADTTVYYGHDIVGADLVRDMANRLKLSSAGGVVNTARLAWLIRNHLVVLNAESIGLRAVERLFLDPLVPGEKLLAVIFADIWASRPANGKPTWGGLKTLQKKIALIRRRGYARKEVKLLVTGEMVMRLLKLQPGPKVGIVLEAVRSAQLEGSVKTSRAAAAFVKTLAQKRVDRRKKRPVG